MTHSPNLLRVCPCARSIVWCGGERDHSSHAKVLLSPHGNRAAGSRDWLRDASDVIDPARVSAVSFFLSLRLFSPLVSRPPVCAVRESSKVLFDFFFRVEHLTISWQPTWIRKDSGRPIKMYDRITQRQTGG